MRKPPESVTAVISTELPRAGPLPHFSMHTGIITPKNAASSKFSVIAATINGVPQQITFADRPNLIRYRNKFLAIAPRHGGAPALIDDTLSTIRGLTRAERQDLIRQIQALLDAEMDEAA